MRGRMRRITASATAPSSRARQRISWWQFCGIQIGNKKYKAPIVQRTVPGDTGLYFLLFNQLRLRKIGLKTFLRYFAKVAFGYSKTLDRYIFFFFCRFYLVKRTIVYQEEHFFSQRCDVTVPIKYNRLFQAVSLNKNISEGNTVQNQVLRYRYEMFYSNFVL